MSDKQCLPLSMYKNLIHSEMERMKYFWYVGQIHSTFRYFLNIFFLVKLNCHAKFRIYGFLHGVDDI
jgi:hypothetical protein